MESNKRIERLEGLLAEAMELVHSNRLMLGMFNKGYYFKLKGKVAAYHEQVSTENDLKGESN